jgi:DNA-binding PadR family transcriptional regulator
MPNPEEHLPLAPHVFEILLTLSQGPRHGYGIIAAVEERTGGAVLIGTSSLYAAIRRMLATGLIEDSGTRPDEQSGGPPRRYYRVTELGLQVARLEADRLRRAAKAAGRLLGQAYAKPRS